jgi:hypothetical protein
MPRTGPRPNAWITGPDPLVHAMYRTFVQARNQAHFRGETWSLSFEEYQALWREHWHLKGRTINDYCMTRLDEASAWALGNVEVLPRQEHFSRANRRRNNIRWGRL